MHVHHPLVFIVRILPVTPDTGKSLSDYHSTLVNFGLCAPFLDLFLAGGGMIMRLYALIPRPAWFELYAFASPFGTFQATITI
jgi:hypothetical protein